jgi:hypothetical protein
MAHSDRPAESDETEGRKQKTEGRKQKAESSTLLTACCLLPSVESPSNHVLSFVTDLPVGYSTVADANDFAHALRLRAKGFVAEQAANILGGLARSDIQMNQTISWVAQLGMVEALVVSEKSRATQLVKQRDDVVAIIHSEAANLDPDLPNVNLPLAEARPLININVFVKKIHAARRRFSVFSIRASHANWMASAMASWLICPP